MGSSSAGSEPPVAVVGAGLAGALAALALARAGRTVTLLGPAGHAGPAEPAATALSYGSLLGRRAAAGWRGLQERYGPLGWRPCGLVLHGYPPPLAWLSPSGLAALTSVLAFSRVDPPTLLAALPAALASAGVAWLPQAVRSLEPGGAAGWRLALADGAVHEVPQVLLAAGSGCRQLWPSLPQRLRSSWAGVLVLPSIPGGNPWLEQVRRGRIVQPLAWGRPALEARSAGLEGEEWLVDAGLAPFGAGALAGQITLVRPHLSCGEPPDPAVMEGRLRRELGRLDPALATLEAPYRQVPVPYALDGRPLVGPVAGAPGLWVFTGMAGAFSLVPELAERLAAAMTSAATG